MSERVLYAAPGTCARVSCILLEEVGLSFDYRLIRFMKGEHKSVEYLRINPKGKVPSLQIDGTTLTENVSIITYLNRCYPNAHLMPSMRGDVDEAMCLADLSYCASSLHPLVTRIRMPILFAQEGAEKSVWQKGCDAMDDQFTWIEQRLDQYKGQWWYGTEWSAVDAYLYWIFWRVEGAAYDLGRFPQIMEHKQRSELRPAIRKALAREAEAEEQLKIEGFQFVPQPIK